jgi:ribokinase
MTYFDVIGFGALNVDKLFKVNKIAFKDEESFVIDFEESCGGSAANTIVGLARLASKVGYIGKVSNDREGRMLLTAFSKEKVDTNGIIINEKGQSGTVMGFVDKTGERALYVNPGVNDTINFNEIDQEYACKTKFLHLTSFVGNKSLQCQKKLVKTLPPTIKVSLDIGELYARKGLKSLNLILKKTYIIMPNAKELEILTRKKDYIKAADVLLDKGVKIVAIKLGKKGCYITNGKKGHYIDAFKVEAVDTTGAGDAFCAGFLYGLINNMDLERCGTLGNFVASKCITKMGARTGLPYLKDLHVLT